MEPGLGRRSRAPARGLLGALPSVRRGAPLDCPSRDEDPRPGPPPEDAPRDGAPRDGAPARGGRGERDSSRSARYGGRPVRAAPPAPAGRGDLAELDRSPDPARAAVGGRRFGPPLELRGGRAPLFCSSSSSRHPPGRRGGRAPPSARRGVLAVDRRFESRRFESRHWNPSWGPAATGSAGGT